MRSVVPALAAALVSALMAACGGGEADPRLVLDEQARLLRTTRSAFEAQQIIAAIGESPERERAREVIAGHLDDGRAMVRFAAAFHLSVTFGDHADAETIARHFALDPTEPLKTREWFLEATSGQGHAWHAAAVSLMVEQAHATGRRLQREWE